MKSVNINGKLRKYFQNILVKMELYWHYRIDNIENPKRFRNKRENRLGNMPSYY